MDEVPDRNLVGVRIRNTENMQDKVVGISLRRREQLKPDVVWAVLGKVIQSNARFGLSDRLEVNLDHVYGAGLQQWEIIKRLLRDCENWENVCLANETVIALPRYTYTSGWASMES